MTLVLQTAPGWTWGDFSKSVMASLEKSRNSLQTGVGVEPLFMLRCDRSPVMLTWLRQL